MTIVFAKEQIEACRAAADKAFDEAVAGGYSIYEIKLYTLNAIIRAKVEMDEETKAKLYKDNPLYDKDSPHYFGKFKK